jgi:hypothetical protein
MAQPLVQQSGDLQTIVQGIQEITKAIAHVTRGIDVGNGTLPTVAASMDRMSASITSAMSNSFPAMVGVESAATATPPFEPDGYLTLNIPGVGPRRIPYYR